MTTAQEIGRRCAQAREAAGWSQEALADAIEVSRQHLSSLENGHLKKADAILVEKIAKALGIPTSRLLGLKAPPKTWTGEDTEIHTQLQALLEEKGELAGATTLVISIFYDHLSRKLRTQD